MRCSARSLSSPPSALVDAMFTITPALRGTMRRATAWATRNIPVRFTRRIRSHAATSISRNGSLRAIPALLMRTSIGPSADSAASTSRATSSSRPTSHVTPSTEPSGESSAVVARTSPSSCPQNTTRLPSSRNRRTVAFPMPLLPPETSTALSVRPRNASPPTEPSRARRTSLPCRACAGWWQTRHGPARASAITVGPPRERATTRTARRSTRGGGPRPVRRLRVRGRGVLPVLLDLPAGTGTVGRSRSAS